MTQVKLKVRPRKLGSINPCVIELTSMLQCWAVAHDLKNSGPCAESAQKLANCMRASSGSKKLPKSTINYHLARLGKHL
ncbi:hypothetical protein FRC03_012146 [Tulasnella sp. 419]|nr:hypothetical protein FRC02_010879 [Tulasnella sp. 418]KAG8966349.1 hypothetical protein FRC03_012146 [Tulasnella sp. 419]